MLFRPNLKLPSLFKPALDRVTIRGILVSHHSVGWCSPWSTILPCKPIAPDFSQECPSSWAQTCNIWRAIADNSRLLQQYSIIMIWITCQVDSSGKAVTGVIFGRITPVHAIILQIKDITTRSGARDCMQTSCRRSIARSSMQFTVEYSISYRVGQRIPSFVPCHCSP